MPEEDVRKVSQRTDLASTGKVATVTRTFPNNMVALSDGVIVEIGPGVRDITIGSRIVYIKGGPGANTGFAMVIAHA